MLDSTDPQFDEEQKALLKAYEKKPKNCAGDFDEPPQKRDPTIFVGLKNQGATCYLNSLLQSVYMIPEFRHAILSLPLCVQDDIKQPSNFVSESKFNFLFPLQKLFAELKALDIKATVTQQVTTAFGWNNNQQLQQHDIQEAYRIIFDILERALEGTPHLQSITNNFRGVQVNHIECLNCHNIKQRESDFYDLIIPVKGINSLEDSLLSMLTMEKLEAPNQYECDSCNQKADALKGIMIRKYPPVLTFSLSRFDFDLEKLQRVKIDSKFTFGVEFDVSMFAEKPELYSDDEKIYELCAVIIHRGDAFGGHYKAYIRDTLKEGDWKRLMTKDEKPNGEEEKKETDLADRDTTDDEKTKKEPSVYAPKNKKAKRKRRRNRTPPPKNEKKNSVEIKDETEKPDDSKYDDVEFPVKFTNEDLKSNWFDFDDANVKPIPMNRLQFQFGGQLENAYLLIYRQRALTGKLKDLEMTIPKYLQKDIEERNEMLESERVVYNEAANNIECFLIDPNYLDVENKVYKSGFIPETQGKKIRIRLDASIDDLLKEVAKQFPHLQTTAEEILIVEVAELNNKLLQLKREIHAAFKDITIKEANIEHLSTYFIFPNKEDNNYKQVANYIGESSVPMRINARYLGKDVRMVTYKNELFGKLRARFSEKFNVPFEQQYIVLMKYSGPENINRDSENDEKDLAALEIADNSDFIIMQTENMNGENGSEWIKSKYPTRREKQQEKKILNSKTENIISVLIESDGLTEPVRYFVELDWTLRDLIQNIKTKLDLDPKSEKRLRRLPEKTLFFEEELELNLRQLAFQDSMKLKLENGICPQIGKMAIIVKNQSKLKKDEDSKTEEAIYCTPNELMSEIKKKACDAFGLEPNRHSLYRVDWLGEPISMFSNKEDRSVQANQLKPSDVIILKDNFYDIPRDMIKFHIHLTKTGHHNDSEYLDLLQISEFDTLGDLKKKITLMPAFAKYKEIMPAQIRLRAIRKDLFFGNILKDEKRELHKFDIEDNSNLVVQVLDHPESLEQGDMVLFVRKRLVEFRSYGEPKEMLFIGGEYPQINDLKDAIIKFEGLDLDLQEIDLVVYNPYEFDWMYVCQATLEEENAKKKAAKRKNAKKGGQNEEKLSLKDGPYYLRDGDIVGYRISYECIDIDDDFQTAEDYENRVRFLKESASKGDEEEDIRVALDKSVGGIRIGVGF